MNAPVTRRALLGATAAVGAVGLPVTAPALAIPVSDPDAELFDLIAWHAAAGTEMERAKCVSDAAFAAFSAAVPPLPVVLRMREGDFPRTGLGIGLSGGEEDETRWYGQRGVDWMRDRPCAAWFPGRVCPLGDADEARRLEIIEAWDAHQAARHAVEVATGYEAACEASDAVGDLVQSLSVQVSRCQPRTLPGLRALGAWFARQVEADDVHDAFFELLAAAVAGFGGVAS